MVVFALLGIGAPATYCVASSADSSTYRQRQSEERTASHSDTSEQGQNQQSGGPITLGLSWIAREIEKANRREDAPDKAAHEKSDVDAQWAMSQWGCLMALMGFWQFVASVVGIIFIRRTLTDNRKAISAAFAGARAAASDARTNRAAFDHQREQDALMERPYVFAGMVQFFWRNVFANREEDGPDRPARHFLVSLVNHGRTPAIFHRLAVRMFIGGEVRSTKEIRLSTVIATNAEYKGIYWWPEGVSDEDRDVIEGGLIQLQFEMRCVYAEIGGRRHDETHAFTYEPGSRSFVREET